MATMTFSVPDDVRDRFEMVFKGHNRNAVITTLLLHVIDEEERRRRSLRLVERLRRVSTPTTLGADVDDRPALRDAAE
jgi:hypothetical protein